MTLSLKLLALRGDCSPRQLDQFRLYHELLAHAIYNITAIKAEDFETLHFQDSLALLDWFRPQQGLMDVGSGGGFPGIPLAILNPDMPVVLVEVAHKKRLFLEKVICTLELAHVSVCSLDWRGCLRNTAYSVDVVCARASLAPREMVRMFQPASPYRHATLAYWASAQWEPGSEERPWVRTQHSYLIEGRRRKIVFFKGDML
jgi:16S rRNA (guanine(527)-N(7))-methyltransferase RsmG